MQLQCKGYQTLLLNLGIAADTLARQANEVAADPNYQDKAIEDISPEAALPGYPAKTLREGAILYKETARAIVR